METSELNLQDLLDKLLNASENLAERGRGYAEEVLDIPEDPLAREQKIDGLKKGAIATAVLVGLLVTKGGRSVTSTAIKLGGIAALGTAAFHGYQRWRDGNSAEGSPVHTLDAKDAHSRAFLLISAMVSAANADGKLDNDEASLLKREVLNMNLSKGLFDQVSEIVDQPLSAAELSAKVEDQAVASEVYMAARIFIDEDSSALEQAYLSELIDGLGLTDELVSSLDRELAKPI